MNYKNNNVYIIVSLQGNLNIELIMDVKSIRTESKFFTIIELKNPSNYKITKIFADIHLSLKFSII